MAKDLFVSASCDEICSNPGFTSTLLGRGLATIQKNQLIIADQDARYRRARDTYDRITDFGRVRRFKPELLPNTGKQFDLFSDEPVNALQPLIDQTIQLADTFGQLKELADEGYCKAYFALANIYKGGQGITENKKRCDHFINLSLKWLLNNQGLNDPEIWRDLGRIYFDRWSKQEEDLDQAIFWYKKAAEQGDAEAQNHLGFMYEHFGHMYEFGLMGEEGFEQAAYWYRKAAEQGHRDAQFQLSSMYEAGKGGEQDYQLSFDWLLEASYREHALALFCHGLFAEDCHHHEEALVSYRKAAEQGLAIAQYKLGTMYEHGLGIEKDLEQAVFWYRQAADREDADAQHNLAWLYEYGLGVEQDETQAAFWYCSAAKIGHARAQTALGYMYSCGWGLEQNEKLAVYWYQKAAEQNFATAQFLLASCYQNGECVEQDDEKAIFWFRKAAEQGDTLSKQVLEKFGIKD
jgi:TPR repeat protein